MEILEPSKQSRDTHFNGHNYVALYEGNGWTFDDELDIPHGPYATYEAAREAYIAYWLDGKLL